MTTPGVLNVAAAPIRLKASSGRMSSDAYGDVLHRVALTVNSSLEIKEVLEQLGNLTLEAIPADRASMFLLDEAEKRLIPTFSSGRVTDIGLWERFRSLDPVDLQEVPDRWRWFRGGRAMGIPDVAASRIIPAEIVEIFGPRSAIIAPLFAGGEPQGVLALDWTAPGRDFGEAELNLAEAIAGYAALAVRNARLYQRLQAKARSNERLVEVSGALNSSMSLKSVLDLICSYCEELLGTSHCSVNLLDDSYPNKVKTLAVRGIAWFTGNPDSIKTVSHKEIERVRRIWKASARPVTYPGSKLRQAVDRSDVPSPIQSVVLFPLVRPTKILGFIVAGFPHDAVPAGDYLEVGQALADQAATAIGRACLHDSLRVRVQRLEVLYRLSDVVAGTADLSVAVRELNRIAKSELGARFGSISIANARLREAVGGRDPDLQEIEAIRSWRASLAGKQSSLGLRDTNNGLLVPIVHRRRVQGALRVTPERGSLDESDQDVLLAIGSGLAEVICKADLRREIVENERRLAIAADRERIARDLHDSVGQLLSGMRMELGTFLIEAPDDCWRERLSHLIDLTSRGSQEVREAIHALVFLEVQRRGLVQSLRALARKVELSSGMNVHFEVSAATVKLSNSHENALFRLAHEALMNVQRHSRASIVSMRLNYDSGSVSLTVRDDGVGLSNRDPFDGGSDHFGLRALQTLIEQLGGSLEIINAIPRGVALEGRFDLKKGGR